jgi:hypothetical protein
LFKVPLTTINESEEDELVPVGYLNIEFAKLELLRDEKGTKCGFILRLHGCTHTFTIV